MGLPPRRARVNAGMADSNVAGFRNNRASSFRVR